MAYYLEFDGVDDEISITNLTTTATEDFELTFIFKPSGSDDLLLGGHSNFYGYPFGNIHMASVFNWDTGVAIAPYVGKVIELTIKRTSGALELLIDKASVASRATGNDGALFFNVIGKNRFGFRFHGDLYGFRFISGLDNRNYDVNFTAETGAPYLVDTVGGNHGTPVGFADFQASLVYYFDWLIDSVEDPLRDNGLTIADTNQGLEISGLSGTTVDFEIKLAEPWVNTGDVAYLIDGRHRWRFNHRNG